MLSSPPLSNSFADELDELMRPISPVVSDDFLDPTHTDEIAQMAIANLEPVESSIGPIWNELAYARHLARFNKLNLYQCDILDQVAKVCLSHASFYLHFTL